MSQAPQQNTSDANPTEAEILAHLAARPLTVRRIARFLCNRYANLIDLRDVATRPLVERIEKFLTRSLAAHAVVAHTKLEPEEAARCVVDGGQDLGLDAIAFDEDEKKCWLVQSKFVQGGQGLIGWDETAKFLNGFEAIVSSKYEHANAKIKARSAEISRAVTEVSWRFAMVLASTSSNPISEHDLGQIHVKMDYQDPGNTGTFTFENFHLNEVTTSVEHSSAPDAINLQIELSDWCSVQEPYIAYYGHVPLSTLISWRQYGPALFEKNLRAFLGTSPVTDSIGDTLRSESEVFWYLNNGATLLCQTIERSGPYSTSESRRTGFFHCQGVSVVNGAQTIGTVWERAGNGENLDPRAKIHIRLISLQDSYDEFGIKVTRATNTQKNILPRDFATLDAAQRRLYNQFNLDGLTYVYRPGISPPRPESGCTLEEVVLALACERSVPFAVIAYRNPGYLTDPDNHYYRTIFHGDHELKSEDAWRAVRIYRISNAALAKERKGLTGRAEQTATHGARYIVHRVFSDSRVKQIRGEWPDNAERIIATVTKEQLTLVATYLETVNRYLQIFFKNTDRVNELDRALAPKPQGPQDTPSLFRNME